MDTDLAVSIGPNCKTAWNLKNHVEDFRARPFDWWICPFYSALKMLRPDFEFDLDDADLHRISAGQTDTIYNSRLNIFQHHDFDRDRDGRVAEGWRDRIPEVRDKFRALFATFRTDLDAASRPVFVLGGVMSFAHSSDLRAAGFVPPGFDSEAISPRAAARALLDVFPDKQLSVVVINPAEQSETVIDPPFYRITRIDNGYRPSFLPPHGFQHPVNVFVEGFDAIGLKAMPADGEVSGTTNNDPARLVRTTSLIEKASRHLAQGTEISRVAGRKYLVAAYQIAPQRLRKTVEELAADHRIDLVADDRAAI